MYANIRHRGVRKYNGPPEVDGITTSGVHTTKLISSYGMK